MEDRGEDTKPFFQTFLLPDATWWHETRRQRYQIFYFPSLLFQMTCEGLLFYSKSDRFIYTYIYIPIGTTEKQTGELAVIAEAI